MLATFTFDGHGMPEGWRFEAGSDGGDFELSDSGCRLVQGGRLLGPVWTCPEDQHCKWYRIRFRVRTDAHGYWLARFLDGNGEELLSSIYGDVVRSPDWCEQTACFRGRWGAAGWQLGLRVDGPCELSVMSVEEIDAETTVAWMETVRGQVPPVKYTPPSERCVRIPRAMKRLKEGVPQRWVMLGDSLTHDTRCSYFDAALDGHYPQSPLDVVLSVRGSTGCWFYHKPENFNQWVARLEPDLLIIGTNPGHEKIGPLKDVAARTRDELGCEVAFLQPAFGIDWRAAAEADETGTLPALAWDGHPLYDDLAVLADEMDIERIDMATPWHAYLGSSRMPHGWFNRDRVHGNHRGMAVVGRMLEEYFLKDEG